MSLLFDHTGAYLGPTPEWLNIPMTDHYVIEMLVGDNQYVPSWSATPDEDRMTPTTLVMMRAKSERGVTLYRFMDRESTARFLKIKAREETWP